MPGPFIWGTTGPAALQPGGIARTNGQILNYDGVKNYLTNPLAETGDTTGWSLGTATLTSNLPTGTPTFGSGASGNLSLAATATTPLSGTYSFSYTSSAATTAGNFLASNAFTVDSADLGKILNFSFSYKATSNPSNGNWSGTTSNSFAVAIYDVTLGAANWIIPVGVFNIIQSANTGVCTGSFQSSVTSGQQYRIVVYNANATAGAITLYFDQLFIGPGSSSVSSSAISWSGTQSSQAVTANTTDVAFTTVKDSSAAWNGTQYIVPFSGDYLICGSAVVSAAATLQVYRNSSIFTNGLFGTGAANTQVSAGAILVTGCKAGDTISLRSNASVTLTSGSLGVALINAQSLGSIGANGVVAARAKVSSGSSTLSTNPVNFDSIDFDTTGSITTGATTWKYTAPVSGYYWVSTNFYFGAGAINPAVYKNGSIFAGVQNSDSDPGAGGTLVQLNAGDTVDFRPNSATGTPSSLTSVTVPQGNYISIFLLQGPSAQQSAPSVNARYFASATSISGSLATVVWTTKDFDSASGMSSGVYTIPITGKYQINAAVATTGTFALNNQVVIEIQKNSSVVSRDKNYAGGIVTDLTAVVSDIISCVAGDTIRIQLSSGATTPTIVSSNFENYFSISLVGA